MPAEALNCPNCSAPLHVEPNQALVLCIYCNSSIRLNRAGRGPAAQAVVEHTLAPEAAAQLRELVLAGRQSEAVERYQQETQANGSEAQRAVQGLAQQISVTLIGVTPLNALGVAYVVVSLVLVIACAAAGLRGAIPLWLAVGGVVVGGFFLWSLRGGVRATLKYLPGQTAPARVLKTTVIGQVGDYSTFRAWMEVQPGGGQPFQAQLTLTAAKQHMSRLHEGTLAQVKYLPGDPDSTVFIKLLKY